MECSFGITGKGYTIIASDSNAARSIVKMKGDEDKMKVLSKHLVMAYNGESGEYGSGSPANASAEEKPMLSHQSVVSRRYDPVCRIRRAEYEAVRD